ncbi:MAG: ribose 5-phosphate isomerase B [Chitinophagales bacterium]|nr:ribose 5-phosphate isomerase B [Chitinophagales bacterium]
MDTLLKIGIGADHAGYEFKEAIIATLEAKGFSVKNFGTYTADSVDYPDYVHPLADAIESNELDLGILICGSANGVCMTANKHQGVRAALAWTEEIAELARKHNNANVICLPARFVSLDLAQRMVEVFINTTFEGGRHQNRVDKISLQRG